MSLKSTASDTLRILSEGAYVAPAGGVVSLRAAVDAAVSATVMIDADHRLPPPVRASTAPCRFEVTGETTAQAARRLVEAEGVAHVALLNFASAKNPGGGFLGGARAQEEDLARASALYTCLCTQRAYYDAHRASASMLYSDRMIYAPAVPFFRDDRLTLLDAPFVVSVITSAAPNAGEALRRDASAGPAIVEALERRAHRVLQVAAAYGHRVLVLGAWGCGVFRNDPTAVANAFAKALAASDLEGAFDRIVFAIYDRSEKQLNRQAFRARFA